MDQVGRLLLHQAAVDQLTGFVFGHVGPPGDRHPASWLVATGLAVTMGVRHEAIVAGNGQCAAAPAAGFA